MDDKVLDQSYKERLEEKLISYLADTKNLTLQDAMDLYYHSRLSNRIEQGEYGIQYLDYKVLAQIVLETEPELFKK